MAIDTKIYKPKKLVPGSVIGKEGLYVAIPNKGFKGCKIRVLFEDKELIIKNWNKAEAFRKFPDQFGSGFYTLGYFKFI